MIMKYDTGEYCFQIPTVVDVGQLLIDTFHEEVYAVLQRLETYSRRVKCLENGFTEK
jgi:hypothetical protein